MLVSFHSSKFFASLSSWSLWVSWPPWLLRQALLVLLPPTLAAGTR